MKMRSKKYKGDSRNFTIIILIFLIIVQGFIIYKLRSEQKRPTSVKTYKKVVVPKTVKTTTTTPTPSLPPAPVIPAPRTPVPPKITAKVAIIVDDWGYGDHCSALKEIPGPIAVSVLPELAYSKASAECAHQNGKEVMLHLPMEAYRNLEHYPENYILKVTAPRSEIEETIDDALKKIPYIVGVNNHMGSKATDNRTFMRILLSSLKERNLFFVDSLVSENSVAGSLAKRLGIPFAKRDVFLDNENNHNYIAGQFAQLIKQARKKGYAIGIGHARSLTLEVIKEQMTLFEKQGIEFVTVKDLLESK